MDRKKRLDHLSVWMGYPLMAATTLFGPKSKATFEHTPTGSRKRNSQMSPMEWVLGMNRTDALEEDKGRHAYPQNRSIPVLFKRGTPRGPQGQDQDRNP